MDLTDIPGIGDKTAIALESSGIDTIDKLLHTYPRTYRTYAASSTKACGAEEWVVLRGAITKPFSKHTGRTTTQLASFKDSEGSLTLRWFNMPYIARSINPQAVYQVMGKVEIFRGTKQIVSPQIKILKPLDATLLPKEVIVPIYRKRGTLKPWVFRTKIESVLTSIEVPKDPLPTTILSRYHLIPYSEAIHAIHQPSSRTVLENAIHRLSFDELLELQLESRKLKKTRIKNGLTFTLDKHAQEEFASSLPFTLTRSQSNAIQEITADFESGRAMHRLLQGEVGSGKTAV